MTHLTGIYFDQYALIYLIQLIQTLAALIYFLRMREKARDIHVSCKALAACFYWFLVEAYTSLVRLNYLLETFSTCKHEHQ